MISPEVGLTIPHTILISVVLPAPFGPSIAMISPCFIFKLTVFKALNPLSYTFERFSIDIKSLVIPLFYFDIVVFLMTSNIIFFQSPIIIWPWS